MAVAVATAAVVMATALAACTRGGSSARSTSTTGGTTTTGVSTSSSTGSTSSSTSSTSSSQPSAQPTLRILSPHDGDQVTAPFEVRYQIAGFAVGPDPAGHLRAYIGADPPNTAFVELYPQSQSGSVSMGGSQLLPGRRDVTFWLVAADGRPVDGPAARVTIHDLVIEGMK